MYFFLNTFLTCTNGSKLSSSENLLLSQSSWSWLPCFCQSCRFNAVVVSLLVLQIDAVHRKEAMKAMTETFYAAIFGYDEVLHAWTNTLHTSVLKFDASLKPCGVPGSARFWSVLTVFVWSGNPVWWLCAGCSSVEKPVQSTVWRPPTAGTFSGICAQTGELLSLADWSSGRNRSDSHILHF